MDTGQAIIIAGVLASAGWVFTQRQNRKLSRLEHTFDVLNSYRHNKDHWDAISKMIALTKGGTLPVPDEAARENDIEAIRKLLIHYEFIAVGIFSGGLDEAMIRECDKGNIVNINKNGQSFIQALRAIRKRDTIYRNLQDLAERWDNKPPGRYKRVLEYFLMRPLRPLTWQTFLHQLAGL